MAVNTTSDVSIRQQRSRFVTSLSVISVFVALYMIVEEISTLTMVNAMSERPEFRMAEQLMPSMTLSPTTLIIDLILYVLSIIASIALFNRLPWGRVMYIVVLSLLTAVGIISSMQTYISLSSYFTMLGMDDSLTMMIAGNMFALGINIFIVWKLSSATIRSEFGG